MNYLRKKYGPRFAAKVMGTLKFANTSTFEEYVKTVQDFVSKDTKTKRKLGFMLHDQFNDGAICPIDVQIFMMIFTKRFSYLLWNDLDLVMNEMLSGIQNIPEKQPGFFLREFEQEFEKYWVAKQTGTKVKRKKLVIDSSESESDLDISSDASLEVKKSTKTAKDRRKTISNRPNKQYVMTKEQALQ